MQRICKKRIPPNKVHNDENLFDSQFTTRGLKDYDIEKQVNKTLSNERLKDLKQLEMDINPKSQS